MSKLSRYTQKLFGSNAGANQIAEFGSLAAGSATRYSGATVTPALIQALGNFLTGWKAAQVGAGNPAIEDRNALDYLFSYQLAYLMQQGVPEWDSATTYYNTSVCQQNGALYQSTTDNNLNNSPGANPGTWYLLAATRAIQLTGALTLVAAIVKSNSSGSFSTSSGLFDNVTNLSVTLPCSGNPILVEVLGDSTGNSYFGTSYSGTSGSYGTFQLKRGSTVIGSCVVRTLFSDASTTNTLLEVPPNLRVYDAPGASTGVTYTVQAQSSTNTTSALVNNCILVAREIL